MKKHYLIFVLILLSIFMLRVPSLFEPFWYGDEGIFAAVGQNLNLGGTLYQTAWDNKPPMIYLTYAGIFKSFGVSMFSLRLVTLIIVLITAAVIYEIAQRTMSDKRALLACAIFGILSSLRLIEGNLSLTEIFMILPISLAMFLAIRRNFDYLSLFSAGLLFAIASLYKQVGALEAAALGLFLFLYTENFWDFLKKGFMLSAGFIVPYAATLGYFSYKHLAGDYIFAAYTYYQIYLAESPRYAILINVAKVLPILAAFSYGFWKKIKKEISLINLLLLWGAFSFMGSFFSGRTYGHYLVQTVPALSLLLASLKNPLTLKKSTAIFLIVYILPIIFLLKTLFAGFGFGNLYQQVSYWQNFLNYAGGKESIDSYNNYFDGNVNSIMETADFLKSKGAWNKGVYIWGDWSWLYAIANLHDPTRYVTSFHVFGVPGGRSEVIAGLRKSPPVYIIKPPRSIGNFPEFEDYLQSGYTLVLQFDNVQIFEKR